MAAFLTHGGVAFPATGSNKVQVLVKHFESDISFDALQDLMNAWLILIGTNVIQNRPVIKNITFSVIQTPPPQPELLYLSQIHYLLIGDADDEPNL